MPGYRLGMVANTNMSCLMKLVMLSDSTMNTTDRTGIIMLRYVVVVVVVAVVVVVVVVFVVVVIFATIIVLTKEDRNRHTMKLSVYCVKGFK